MKTSKRPPQWADRFLEWYCRPELLEEIQGDIYELFSHRSQEKSLNYARRCFVWDVLRSFRLSTIKHLNLNHNTMMFKNHVKFAFRMLQKKRGFAALNIAGITISLVFALLMLLWVQDEFMVNKFHPNGANIYRLHMGFVDADGNIDVSSYITYQLGKAAETQIPEVEKSAFLGDFMSGRVKYKDKEIQAKGAHTNQAFFEIFAFPILAGSLEPMFKNSNTIILSKSLAEKFFGKDWQTQAIGQFIELNNGKNLKVEAVFEDIPKNSTIKFDFFRNVQDYLNENRQAATHWGYHAFEVYAQAKPNAERVKIQRDVTKIYEESDVYDEGELVVAQAFEDIYLYSRFNEKGISVGGRIEYVRIFFGASIFLLLIAGINFINLATARASQRAKEVGLRKVVGARTSSLISQFLIEAGLITFISIGLALGIAELLLPFLKSLTGKTLYFDYFSLNFWLFMSVIFLGITLFSGIYPSLILSSFKITQVLKRNVNSNFGGNAFRRGLVVLQFVLSLILIVGAVVVRQQIHYIKNKNLGLDRNQVIYIKMNPKIQEKYQVLRAELLKQRGIEVVTTTSHNPLSVGNVSNGVDWPGKEENDSHIHFNMLWVDYEFEETFKVALKEGRYFQKNMPSDPEKAIIVNEKAVEVMGLKNPLGTILEVDKPRQIVGIVKDFHINTLYKNISPMVMLPNQGFNWSMFVRTKTSETPQALESLSSVFKEVIPETPLEYEFLNDYHEKKYKSELLTGTLADYFALFSIFISCLGLYGLASFLAEQKTKEIAIRKVLGATIFQIITLLSKKFLPLVILGLGIGTPLAWYFTQSWLQKFVYHIDAQWWMFVIPTLIAIFIAAFTVGYQGILAALKNPIHSLKED